MSRSHFALAALLVAMIAALTALTTWPALAPAAPVPAHLFPKKETEPDYFPDRIGTTWVYEVQGGWWNSETTEVVTGVEHEEGVKVIHLSGEWNMRISDEGVFLSGFRPVFLGHPQPVCVFKPKCQPGDSWKSLTYTNVLDIDSHVVRDFLPERWVAKVGKSEVIDVPAGRFRALRVDLEIRLGDGWKIFYDPDWSGGYTMWYADGVGLVKQEHYRVSDSMLPKKDPFSVMVLKSFTPGKE